jgi:hypothetical protein
MYKTFSQNIKCVLTHFYPFENIAERKKKERMKGRNK